jgi:hypothetical protein
MEHPCCKGVGLGTHAPEVVCPYTHGGGKLAFAFVIKAPMIAPQNARAVSTKRIFFITFCLMKGVHDPLRFLIK